MAYHRKQFVLDHWPLNREILISLLDKPLAQKIRADLMTQAQGCFDAAPSPMNEFHILTMPDSKRYQQNTGNKYTLGTKALFVYSKAFVSRPAGDRTVTANLHVVYYVGVSVKI